MSAHGQSPPDAVPVQLAGLTTETPNPRSTQLDTLTVAELLALMNDEDAKVAGTVRQALPHIARAVELIVDRLGGGGRLVYLGAGTSGRLGVLDAAECPPTFGTDPGQVVGLIAGGETALLRAVEGAEDSPELAAQDLQHIALTADDVVVGLTASGRTPYVLGGLTHARATGAATVSVACNSPAAASGFADVAIELDNGPEVLTGSTRLKAGTSTKLVLNMLSTAAMVQLGKVFGNLMVDVVSTNQKLERRAQDIIAMATGIDEHAAAQYYERAGRRPKTAIVMILAGVDRAEAEQRLDAASGFVREALTT
jgi:N-acetylmuramic acid 6-phosphate etherase